MISVVCVGSSPLLRRERGEQEPFEALWSVLKLRSAGIESERVTWSQM
jgi:hypothetical protein